MKTECVNLSLSLLFWIVVCSLYSNRLMKENGKCRFVQALRSLHAINSGKWIPKKCSCLLKSWWKFKLIQNLILMILICLLNLVLFSLFAKQWVEDYCVVCSFGKTYGKYECEIIFGIFRSMLIHHLPASTNDKSDCLWNIHWHHRQHHPLEICSRRGCMMKWKFLII